MWRGPRISVASVRRCGDARLFGAYALRYTVSSRKSYIQPLGISGEKGTARGSLGNIYYIVNHMTWHMPHPCDPSPSSPCQISQILSGLSAPPPLFLLSLWSRFPPSLPLCGAYPIVGECGSFIITTLAKTAPGLHHIAPLRAAERSGVSVLKGVQCAARRRPATRRCTAPGGCGGVRTRGR